MTNLVTTAAKNGGIIIKTETADHALKINANYINKEFTYGVYVVLNRHCCPMVLNHPLIVRSLKRPLEECINALVEAILDSRMIVKDGMCSVTWNGVKDAIVFKEVIDLEKCGDRFAIDIAYKEIKKSMNCETYSKVVPNKENDGVVVDHYIIHHIDRSTIQKIDYDDRGTTKKYYRPCLELE